MKRLIQTFVIGVLFLTFSSSVQASILTDNFDAGINSNMWESHVEGIGPTVMGAAGQLKLSLPATSNGGSSPFATFGSEIVSKCKLRGDFDFQADFELNSWPSESGARTGILLGDGFSRDTKLAVERLYFGRSDFFNDPIRNGYLMHDLVDGNAYLYESSDLEGKLRIVRSGGRVTSYIWQDDDWVILGNGAMVTRDLNFGIGLWSHNIVFADQQVDTSFDNLVINSGELVDCPTKPTPAPLEVEMFKQSDPEWGGDIYASANRVPLDCGTTMAQCGCATSSVAMVLNYHGATRDPLTGGPTTPETVNNYFRQNEKCIDGTCVSRGYSGGSVVWWAAANYSAEASNKFGTQKIEYLPKEGYDADLTKADIAENKPVILKVLQSSHWAVAIGDLIDTLALNDPGHNRTKLSDSPYNNNTSHSHLIHNPR